MEEKPSRILTSSGSSKTAASVSGISAAASLESTGLMQKALTASACSFVRVPWITYVVAVRITGSSFSFKSFTHCSAESALWSNWPGRYSTEKTVSPAPQRKVPSNTSSRGGSEKIVANASS